VSGKNEQEVTLTVAQIAKGISAAFMIIVAVISWSMYEGVQASDIKANATAIETNKEANDKEQEAQNKTIEKLDTTVESLTTAVTKLNATLEVTLEMAKKTSL